MAAAETRVFLQQFFEREFKEHGSAERACKLLQDYQKREKELIISIKHSEGETSLKFSNVVKACEEMLEELQAIQEHVKNLLTEYEDYKTGAKEKEDRITKMRLETEELKQKEYLLCWSKASENVISQIELAVERKDITSAVNLHNRLYKTCDKLKQTSCEKMKISLKENCELWFKKLKVILLKDFQDVMVAIKYPFPTGITSPVFSKKEETEEKFKTLITQIMKLNSINHDSSNSLLSEFLVQPMRKRFCFHFYGKRHTNDKSKPEWFFTQVINWIRDHEVFYDDHIQKFLGQSEHGSSGINVKEECFKLLVKLCQDKLSSLIDEVNESESLFAHLIDEALIFEEEMKKYVPGLPYSDRCVRVLFQDEYLEKWLELEKNFAANTIASLLDGDNEVWESKYDALTDSKEKNILYYVPKCVEEFMTFLSVMSLRHKSLENVRVQQKFLGVLQYSLMLFLQKLKDISSLESKNPVSQTYCAILNGISYTSCVLEEWNDDLYFFTLQQELNVNIEDEANMEDVGEKIFSSAVLSINQLKNERIDSMVKFIESCLQPKIKSYRNEKWHAMCPLKDYITPVLTASAGGIMLYLKDQLYALESKLCTDIFQEFWKSIAKKLDELIFDVVVFDSHFNEGGASQLQYDIKNNLFLVFGKYTSKPDSHFKLLRESFTVLNLLPGSAILLKEVFEQAEATCNSLESKEDFVKNNLKEVGVKHLTYTQVHRLLISRIDWPKT